MFLNEHYRPAYWGNVVLVVIRQQQRDGKQETTKKYTTLSKKLVTLKSARQLKVPY